MEQIDLLRYVTGIIEDLGLRYFVTGSTATIFYGEPRFTNDIDIVIELPDARTVDFCRRFPHDEFYVSETAARQAVRDHSQFNIIHPESGLKVDVIVPESNLFNESRFSRTRRLRAADDFDASFTSPEDAIIKKMQYFHESGSEKHIRDILGVMKISRENLDVEYIAHWATQMGLGDIWSAILERTSPTL